MKQIRLWILLGFVCCQIAQASETNGFAPNRFLPIPCWQRMKGASSFVRATTAITDMRISRYLDGAISTYELGQRFRALTRGRLRNAYDDLETIADFMEHVVDVKLRNTGVLQVGVRPFLMEMVSRPVARWSVSFFNSDIHRAAMANTKEPEHGSDVVLYTIEHSDGTKSYVVGYRDPEAERHLISWHGDRRKILNAFIISGGLNHEAQATVLRAQGFQLLQAEVNAAEFVQYIEQQRNSGAWLEVTPG